MITASARSSSSSAAKSRFTSSFMINATRRYPRSRQSWTASAAGVTSSCSATEKPSRESFSSVAVRERAVVFVTNRSPSPRARSSSMASLAPSMTSPSTYSTPSRSIKIAFRWSSPLRPSELVEQERRQEADEHGCREQSQEVGEGGDVSELARRQQANQAGRKRGKRADDAGGQERRGSVATRVLRFPPSQVARGDEHQDVHDQVDLCRQGGEYPVGARDCRHHGVEHTDHRDDESLRDQDVKLDAVGVELLKVRRQVAALARDVQQAGGGAGEPVEQAAQGGDGQPDSDDRCQHVQPEVVEQALERLHHTRGEADVARGNGDRDRERGEDEDKQDQHHGEECCSGEFARGVAQLIDVDGVDLDPGIEEEAVDDQDDAGQTVPGWEQMVRAERRGRGVSLQEIDRRQHNEKQAGDQRPDEDPVGGQAASGEHAAARDEH